jgi:hypothetical protein
MAERTDRPALQLFTCTEPSKWDPVRREKIHPRPWELEVQSGIRSQKPPISPDQHLLLGEDEDGLGAVCLLAEQDSPEIVKLRAIAIAMRHRNRHEGHADEALNMALQSIADRLSKTAITSGVAVGWIHPKNRASKRMCERGGLQFRRLLSNGLEEWVVSIELE